MKHLFDARVGLLRAARRVLMVVGAGALGAVVCSTGVCLVAPTAPESSTASGRGGSAVPASPMVRTLGSNERRALDLLRRADRAEAAVAYQGTKEFRSWSIWGHLKTSAIVRNVPGKGTTVQATDIATGHLIGVDNVLDLNNASLKMLVDTYRLRIGGASRLLDRPVTRVDVSRPSGGAPVGQFWVDDETGLAIQRDLFNSAGTLIHRTAFTKLRITIMVTVPTLATTPSPAPSATPQTSSTCGDGLAQNDLDRLTAAGWALPVQLPGALKRVCVREVGTGTNKSVQLSYSDGLFALSLFVQRGRLGAAPAGFDRREVGGTGVYLRCGFYRELIWASEGMVYTVVTDLPDATLAQVVRAVPEADDNPGVVSRMNRGIRRVGSWVDPFN